MLRRSELKAQAIHVVFEVILRQSVNPDEQKTQEAGELGYFPAPCVPNCLVGWAPSYSPQVFQ